MVTGIVHKKILGTVGIVAHYIIWKYRCVIFSWTESLITKLETTALGFRIYLSKEIKLHLRIVPLWNNSKSLMTKAIPAILKKKKQLHQPLLHMKTWTCSNYSPESLELSFHLTGWLSCIKYTEMMKRFMCKRHCGTETASLIKPYI